MSVQRGVVQRVESGGITLQSTTWESPGPSPDLRGRVRNLPLASAAGLAGPNIAALARSGDNDGAVAAHPSGSKPIFDFIKRGFDIVAALSLLLLFSPVFAVLALRIARLDGFPIFFGSKRLGRDARVFTAWKFRTMEKDAENVLKAALETDDAVRQEWQTGFKLARDPRITASGDVLRRTSLDELPQLWNVVRGQMSLVGPRPILLDEPAHYGPSFETYKTVRPGITGLWQVLGRNDVPYPQRVIYNNWYIRHRSMLLDLQILFRTALVVIKRLGAR